MVSCDKLPIPCKSAPFHLGAVFPSSFATSRWIHLSAVYPPMHGLLYRFNIRLALWNGPCGASSSGLLLSCSGAGAAAAGTVPGDDLAGDTSVLLTHCKGPCLVVAIKLYHYIVCLLGCLISYVCGSCLESGLKRSALCPSSKMNKWRQKCFVKVV